MTQVILGTPYRLSLAISSLSRHQIEHLSPHIVEAIDLFHYDHFDIGHECRSNNYLDIVASAAYVSRNIRYDVHCFEPYSEVERLCREYLIANPQLKTFYAHIDLRRLTRHDVKELSTAQQRIEPMGVQLGLAFQSFTGINTRLQEVQHLVSIFKANDILVMGPGPDGNLDKFRINTLSVLAALYNLKQLHLPNIRIGIDRLVTPAKITEGIRNGATDFIVGSYVLGNPHPLARLRDIKAALT